MMTADSICSIEVAGLSLRVWSTEVSTFLLLLPLILTTAFVIFGAWRRAVRDAEVEVEGEDE